MNLRCKPGDMAMVVRTHGSGSNLGKVVMVRRFIRSANGRLSGAFNLWETDEPMRWTFIDGTSAMLPFAPDNCLMPIRPDELKEEEQETEKAI